MTVLIAEYDPDTGIIHDYRHVADHDYTPGADEIEIESGDPRDLIGMMVDTSTDPPSLVEQPDREFDHPGVIDETARDYIADLYRNKGAAAIQARDDMAGNADIPQSVVDFADATIAMQYLVYVSLTGDRIQSVEDRFFTS